MYIYRIISLFCAHVLTMFLDLDALLFFSKLVLLLALLCMTNKIVCKQIA